MKRILNTFKYGSWRIRLFFGTIGLLFLGGIAAIAVAAIAGLGIIPIAVGGAALVMGIGMSTMVTVVSDDEKDKPQKKPGEPDKETAGPSGAAGEEAGGQTGDAAGTSGKVGEENSGNTGETSGASGAAGEQNGANTGESAGSFGKASEQTKPANPGKTESNIIHAEDDGSYVPDIIKEEMVAKATYKEDIPKVEAGRKGKTVSDTAVKQSVNVASDAEIKQAVKQTPDKDRKQNVDVASDAEIKQAVKKAPDKAIKQSGNAVSDAETKLAVKKISEAETGQAEIAESNGAGLQMRKVKQPRYTSPSEGAFIEGLPPEKTEKAEIRENIDDSVKTVKNEETENTVPGIENSKKKRNTLFSRFRTFLANRAAAREHIREGKRSRDERRDIKRKVRKKTDEYGRQLEEKFENELSFADREKLREDEYAQNIRNRQDASDSPEGIRDRQNASDSPEGIRKRQDTSDSLESIRNIQDLTDTSPETAEAEQNTNSIFGKLGKLFTKLFANVHDEPQTTGQDDDPKDGPSGRREQKRTAAEEKNVNDKKKAKKDKKKKEKKKEKEEIKQDAAKDEKAKKDDPVRSSKNEEDEEEITPPRERLPGEELDVSKYTASNMKKIIKAKKLGKDFIPVFIESWDSQHIEKTPALCFVKDDKVHFLLLEGDMERDVSVPVNKFVNVWYKKNAPVTNLKAYNNIKENMGAFEMFEDVVPNFSASTDQMGGTSYTQNLYLLGKDIALAPPSMRELRKRFRFNTNIFDSLNTRGDYSDYFKKAYETRILWTDNVIGLQDYQRRIRAILQEMVNDTNLLKFEFEDEVAKMVQFRLITDEYAEFYINMKNKQ